MNAVDELNLLLGIGPPKAKLPKTLEKSGYISVRPIGKGGFGQAHLIFHTHQKQNYVAKHINLATLNQKQRKEAHNEINVLQQLSHPNIVRYVEYCEEHPHLYIIMEYADGGDLASHLKKLKDARKNLSEEQVVSLFAQVGLALQYMHDHRILHRDIKSHNVFLTKKHVVKLGDFGISTVLQNTIAMAKTVCGTPCYFSPELCAGKPYNSKSDIWAMGILLYELMTTNLPFETNNLKKLMDMILNQDPPPLPPGHGYSPDLVALMMSMLKKDPHQRPDIKQILRSQVIQSRLPSIVQQLGIYAANDVGRMVDRPLPTASAEPPQQQQQRPLPSGPVGRGQPDPMRVSQLNVRGTPPDPPPRQQQPSHHQAPAQQFQTAAEERRQQQLAQQQHQREQSQQQQPAARQPGTATPPPIKNQVTANTQGAQGSAVKAPSSSSPAPPLSGHSVGALPTGGHSAARPSPPPPQPAWQEQPQQPSGARPQHFGDTHHDRYDPVLLRMASTDSSDVGAPHESSQSPYRQHHQQHGTTGPVAASIDDDDEAFVVHHTGGAPGNVQLASVLKELQTLSSSVADDCVGVEPTPLVAQHNMMMMTQDLADSPALAQRPHSGAAAAASEASPQQRYFVDEFGATLDVQGMLEAFEDQQERKAMDTQQQSSASLTESQEAITGQCLCGGVQFSTWLSQVYGTFTCNCHVCKRLSGSSHGVDWLHVPELRFEALVVDDPQRTPQQQGTVRQFLVSEEKDVTSSALSCSECGSLLAMNGHRGVSGCTLAGGVVNGDIHFRQE